MLVLGRISSLAVPLSTFQRVRTTSSRAAKAKLGASQGATRSGDGRQRGDVGAGHTWKAPCSALPTPTLGPSPLARQWPSSSEYAEHRLVARICPRLAVPSPLVGGSHLQRPLFGHPRIKVPGGECSLLDPALHRCKEERRRQALAFPSRSCASGRVRTRSFEAPVQPSMASVGRKGLVH